MKAPTQSGFDFGNQNFASDVFAIFDRSDFPNVTPEEVVTQIGSTLNYGMKVYRKAMEIWESVLDEEIVSELRNSCDFEGGSIDRIAVALCESASSIQQDLYDAYNSLRNGLESTRLENAA